MREIVYKLLTTVSTKILGTLPPSAVFSVFARLLVLPILYFKPLFLNAPGSIAFSQEHFKTISYAKFGGQTECIMGNWKIVNVVYHS